MGTGDLLPVRNASQGLSLNASAEVKLAAKKNTSSYEAILFWMVDGSNSTAGMTFNGGGNTRLFGSIYAPQAHVELSGNYGGGSFLEGQMIVSTLTVTGSAQTCVNYNSNYTPPARPYAVLIR